MLNSKAYEFGACGVDWEFVVGLLDGIDEMISTSDRIIFNGEAVDDKYESDFIW